MAKCKPRDTPISYGDKFSIEQCPRNEVNKALMKDLPYAIVVGSLIYA